MREQGRRLSRKRRPVFRLRLSLGRSVCVKSPRGEYIVAVGQDEP